MPAWTRATTVQHGSYRRVDCAGLCAPLVVCRTGPGVCRALRSLRTRSVRLGAEAGHPTRSRGSFHPPWWGITLPLSFSLSLALSPSLRRVPFLHLSPVPLPRFRSLSLPLASVRCSRVHLRIYIHTPARSSLLVYRPGIQTRSSLFPSPLAP